MNKKIKTIRPMRPSYILVVGERELQEGSVSVRNRSDRTRTMKIKDFIAAIEKEIREYSVDQSI